MRISLRYTILTLTILTSGCSDKAAPPKPVRSAKETSKKPKDKSEPQITPVDDWQNDADVSSLLKPDFVAAVVIRPNRAFESPLVRKLLAAEPALQARREDLEREIGVDPKLIDEMIFLFDRDSLKLPPRAFVEDPRFMPALIVRHQQGTKQMAGFPPFIFTESPKEKVYEGKRYLVGGQTAVHFFSKTSFVASSEDKLKKMLSVKDPRGPLAEGRAEQDLVVAVDLESISDRLEVLRKSRRVQEHPELAKMLKQLSQAKRLTFRMDLTEKPLLQLEIIGKDGQAATQLQKDIAAFLKSAKAGVPQESETKETQTIPAGIQAFLPLAQNALNNLRLKKERNQLVVELQMPHAELPGLLEPYFEGARAERKRQQDRINLIQISLSLFGTYSVDRLLARAIADSEGKPLLSWRVALLPYIDQRELYQKFHLDEPWDSPHNKSLIPLMPEFYRFQGDPEDGRTRILAVVGNESAFDVKVPPHGELDDAPLGRSESEFEDGKAGTMVLVVVARDKAVPWTKPADFSLHSPKLLEELGTLPEETFWALMRDMSPRQLPSDIDQKTFHALATIAGGERIDPAIARDDEEFAERLQAENARPHRSLEVARKLEALGAEVEIDEKRRVYSVTLPEKYKLAEGESADEAMPLLKELPDLKSLSLSATRIAPASFAHLAELKDLESLVANHCGFPDDAAKHLSGLTLLVHLNLAGNPITDEALSALEKMERLESLDLTHTKVTGRGLQHLPQNGNLRRLSLDRDPLIDEELIHLGKIRSLEELDFSFSTIGDSGLAHLASMPALKGIALTRTNVTDLGLKHLGKIKSLKSVNLYASNIEGSGLADLVGLPRLKSLNLWETPLDADEAIKHIAKMSHLETLVLTECDITDSHILQLKPLKELSSLALGQTQITDKSMDVLVKFPKLDSLSLTRTKVSSQAIEKFSKAKPNCFVYK